MARQLKYRVIVQDHMNFLNVRYWWWNILSTNGQIIQTSESYKTFESVWKSVSGFCSRHLHIGAEANPKVHPNGRHKIILPKMEFKDAPVTSDRIEIFMDVAKLPRWRIRASNGRIITSGESYRRLQTMRKGITNFRDELRNFRLMDKILDTHEGAS
jgi:uncharacterized protein YegP (UPF0339 family)